MSMQPGEILENRYRVANLLGEGGFGAVYQAWDMRLNRPCAIKENQDATPEAQAQFNREATILANLNHPNLARVTDYFFLPGQGQYLVMDFVEGEDLHAMVSAGGSVPQDQALDWIGQVCDALEYIHTQNPPIIHRDIKPANIKITPQGKAVLVDFGIAKIWDETLRTTRGARAVTPGYSPFEQYGQAPTDARTDVYAIGATLYTLLTGKEPPEVTLRMAGEPLPPPRKFSSKISPKVEGAVLKAMEIKSTARFRSVAEFKAALGLQPPATKSKPRPQPRMVNATIPISDAPAVMAPAAPAVAIPVAAAAGATAAGPSKPASKKLGAAGIIGIALAAVACLALAGILGVKWLLPMVFPGAQSTLVVSPSSTSVAPSGFKACLAAFPGSLDDHSMNQVAWEGFNRAANNLGVGIDYALPPDWETDSLFNTLESLRSKDCGLIIAGGFPYTEALAMAARANPSQAYALLDATLDTDYPNVRTSLFRMEEPSYLAGYLAAGMSRTGRVGTYGGMQIPPVTAFMDGFYQGVLAYNKDAKTSVQVIGWNMITQTGEFSGDFSDAEKGKEIGIEFLQQGIDVIFPVAGPVGSGTLDLVSSTNGDAMIIGVDVDWTLLYPDQAESILASVVKHYDSFAFESIQQAQMGAFTNGKWIGTLANNGVGLVINPVYEASIPVQLNTWLNLKTTQIKSGGITISVSR